MDINYSAIGNRIREKRTISNLTQAALAEKAGIEPSNLSHIERGATKVSLPTLMNIANVLEVTLDELVYEALSWICKNQLGRRNLTPQQKKYLIGQRYKAEKQIHGVIEKVSKLHPHLLRRRSLRDSAPSRQSSVLHTPGASAFPD